MLMLRVMRKVVIIELSTEVEMVLTSKWQAVVGDEFDIVVSD